jgi:hypothetical protein
VVTWLGMVWPGVVGLAVVMVIGLAGLRVIQPAWFARFVAGRCGTGCGGGSTGAGGRPR